MYVVVVAGFVAATVSDAAYPPVSEQPEGSTTVSTPVALVKVPGVGEHEEPPLKVDAKVTSGDAPMAKSLAPPVVGNVAVTESPATRLPGTDGVKSTVHVVGVLAAYEMAVKRTADTAIPEGMMTTLLSGDTGVWSSEVATLKPDGAYVPAGGLVTEVMVSVADVLTGSEQVPPLLYRVTVSVEPTTVPVAAQFVNPLASPMVGLADNRNDTGNTTVTVSPATSAPVLEVLKPTVQVSVALPLLVAPAKVTAETLTPDAESGGTDSGFAATTSELVATLKLFAA